MIKYIVFAIIVIAMLSVVLIIITANWPKKEKRVEDITCQVALEALKKELEVKMETLENQREIKKLSKKRDDVIAQINKLNP